MSNPAVGQLEANWGARCRSDPHMRKWFSRRKGCSRLAFKEMPAPTYACGQDVSRKVVPISRKQVASFDQLLKLAEANCKHANYVNENLFQACLDEISFN